MRSHELDPWSLVFGVGFLCVAGSYLLTHTTSVHLHWLLVAPAALIVAGVAIFGGVISRMRRSAEVDDDRRVV